MPTAQDAESLRLKALISRHHPDYDKNIYEWKFLRQAVEGGPNYVEGNLFKHPQEDPKVYAERSRRAADNHFNICQLINDTYEGYVFQTYPQLEETATSYAAFPVFQKFVDESDMNGMPLVSLAQSVMHWMDTYGIIWVCVDKPTTSVLPASAAQEVDLGLLPYGYIVHPTHVLNGKIDRGIVQWLLVQEDILDNNDPWGSSGQVVTQWRLWERNQSTVIQMHKGPNGEEVYTSETIPNDLGEVPFVRFTFMDADGFACKGLLSDIAHMDRAIFNKCSLLDEIHYKATFPQLVVPFEGQLFDEDGLTSEGKSILTMGLNSVLPYHSASGAPSYISPSSGPAESLEGNILKMSHLALSLALLDGEVSNTGGTKTAASGVSKAYIFEKLNRRLANIADTLQEGFWNVFRLVATWMDKDPTELPSTIWTFPDSFEVRSLAQEIADAISLLMVGVPSDNFKKVLFKELVRKAYPDLTNEEIAAIENEIDSFNYSTMDVHWQTLVPDGTEVAQANPKSTPPGASRKPNPNHDAITQDVATNAVNGVSQDFGGRNNGKTS